MPDAELALMQALAREPHRFHLDQALRRLECVFADHPRLGTSRRAGDDPVRLGQTPSLGFAPTTLERFGKDRGETPWLKVLFPGLFGPNGPLPLHLTEHAIDRIQNHSDRTFARFLDIFHHRLISLFYRAWADAQPTVHLDRPRSDRFQLYVGSVCGRGPESLRERDEFPHQAKLYHAGLYAHPTRSAEGLAIVLEDYFRVPARVEQFVGHWLELPADSVTRLGAGSNTAVLGTSVVLGGRVWECTQKFRIVLGPMGLADYVRLLPGGRSIARLRAAVRNYIGFELGYDVRLILAREGVTPLALGSTQQLGRTSWLVSRPKEADAGDLVLPLA
ncbi:MAG: type VI secretion system baseplate subunit TssG [Planctomycetota bacterium]